MAKRAEIEIYDVIGGGFWADGVTAKRIKQQLDNAGDVETIDVRINSPGGSVWDGWAIYNLLKDHRASVSVHVDGIALSAASIIAMAGDEILMAQNAMLMIHNPLTWIYGEAADLRKEAELLDKWRDTAVGMYADRTGQKKEEIQQWMDAETWFTADEAMAKGFATGITKNKAKSAKVDNRLSNSFKNVPDAAKAIFLSVDVDNCLVNLFTHVPDAAKALFIESHQNQSRGVPTMAATPATSTGPAPVTTATVTTATVTTPAAAPAVNTPAPAAAPEAPKALTAEDVTAAAAKAVADERKRASDIRALIGMAKLPENQKRELEEKMIAGGSSVDQARTDLFNAMCACNTPVGENGNGNLPAADADENAKFKREYADYAKHCREFKIPSEDRMSEEEFVRMRRVDEGLETLKPAAK